MATNFDKFDKSMDLDSLKNDIKNAASDSEYPEIPHGTYAVEIAKLELTVSKKGDPMVTCWMKIVDGNYKGSTLFMNQVVNILTSLIFMTRMNFEKKLPGREFFFQILLLVLMQLF